MEQEKMNTSGLWEVFLSQTGLAKVLLERSSVSSATEMDRMLTDVVIPVMQSTFLGDEDQSFPFAEPLRLLQEAKRQLPDSKYSSPAVTFGGVQENIQEACELALLGGFFGIRESDAPPQQQGTERKHADRRNSKGPGSSVTQSPKNAKYYTVVDKTAPLKWMVQQTQGASRSIVAAVLLGHELTILDVVRMVQQHRLDKTLVTALRSYLQRHKRVVQLSAPPVVNESPSQLLITKRTCVLTIGGNHRSKEKPQEVPLSEYLGDQQFREREKNVRREGSYKTFHSSSGWVPLRENTFKENFSVEFPAEVRGDHEEELEEQEEKPMARSTLVTHECEEWFLDFCPSLGSQRFSSESCQEVMGIVRKWCEEQMSRGKAARNSTKTTSLRDDNESEPDSNEEQDAEKALPNLQGLRPEVHAIHFVIIVDLDDRMVTPETMVLLNNCVLSKLQAELSFSTTSVKRAYGTSAQTARKKTTTSSTSPRLRPEITSSLLEPLLHYDGSITDIRQADVVLIGNENSKLATACVPTTSARMRSQKTANDISTWVDGATSIKTAENIGEQYSSSDSNDEIEQRNDEQESAVFKGAGTLPKSRTDEEVRREGKKPAKRVAVVDPSSTVLFESNPQRYLWACDVIRQTLAVYPQFVSLLLCDATSVLSFSEDTGSRSRMAMWIRRTAPREFGQNYRTVKDSKVIIKTPSVPVVFESRYAFSETYLVDLLLRAQIRDPVCLDAKNNSWESNRIIVASDAKLWLRCFFSVWSSMYCSYTNNRSKKEHEKNQSERRQGGEVESFVCPRYLMRSNLHCAIDDLLSIIASHRLLLSPDGEEFRVSLSSQHISSTTSLPSSPNSSTGTIGVHPPSVTPLLFDLSVMMDIVRADALRVAFTVKTTATLLPVQWKDVGVHRSIEVLHKIVASTVLQFLERLGIGCQLSSVFEETATAGADNDTGTHTFLSVLEIVPLRDLMPPHLGTEQAPSNIGDRPQLSTMLSCMKTTIIPGLSACLFTGVRLGGSKEPEEDTVSVRNLLNYNLAQELNGDVLCCVTAPEAVKTNHLLRFVFSPFVETRTIYDLHRNLNVMPRGIFDSKNPFHFSDEQRRHAAALTAEIISIFSSSVANNTMFPHWLKVSTQNTTYTHVPQRVSTPSVFVDLTVDASRFSSSNSEDSHVSQLGLLNLITITLVTCAKMAINESAPSDDVRELLTVHAISTAHQDESTSGVSQGDSTAGSSGQSSSGWWPW